MHLDPVDRRMLVEDDDVGTEALQPPVLVCAQHLANQGQIVVLDHAHDQDRQVAGDAVRPQAGLPERVSREERGCRAERGVGPQDVRRETFVELRFIRRDSEVTQPHLGLGAREREGSSRRSGVVVLLGQCDRRRPARRDAGRKCETHLPAWGDAHALAQAQDRVEDCPRGARECPAVERDGILGRASAAKESGAISFPLDGALAAAFGAQHVHGPRCQFIG